MLCVSGDQRDLCVEKDLLAIRALADRYSDAACRRDPAAMAAVYARDGELVAFGNIIAGRNTLEATFAGTCETFALINQICSGAVINVDGDKATSRWTVTEYVRRSESENLELFMGNYDDELRKVDGTWQFVRRVLTRRGQARFQAEFR